MKATLSSYQNLKEFTSTEKFHLPRKIASAKSDVLGANMNKF